MKQELIESYEELKKLCHDNRIALFVHGTILKKPADDIFREELLEEDALYSRRTRIT